MGIGAGLLAGANKVTGAPGAAGEEVPPMTPIYPGCIIPTASISVI